MESREIKFILSSSSPFDQLRESEVNNLLKFCEVHEYHNSEIIYTEGEESDFVYILLKGRVEILTSRDGRQPSVIEILKRGTSFGIISALTDDFHSVTAKSIENSFILKIPKAKFKIFLNKHPRVSLGFSRMLSQRVKSRFKPKTIFQSKRIAVLGDDEQSSYAYWLCLELKEQTGKKVIYVKTNYSSSGPDSSFLGLFNFSFSKKESFSLKNFSENRVNPYIHEEKIDILLVELDNISALPSLLNFLSENYHFVIYELSWSSLKYLGHELIDAVHYIHALIEEKEQPDNLNWLSLKAREHNFPLRERLRVLLKEEQKNRLSLAQKAKRKINYPIYATLSLSQQQDYFKTIRRIAREIGEITLGVALGSGAAYGFCHIGVLEVLEKNNIIIDIVCGSSMGAVVAALWASGFSYPDIIKHAGQFGKKIGRFSFMGISLPLKGVVTGRRLENILRGIFKDLTFKDLKHTLRIITFDFSERKSLVIEEGLLYKAVAASCAMPGVFEPIRWEGKVLLDGGIVSPLPVNTLLTYGARKIIASDVIFSSEEAVREYKRRKNLHIFDFIFGSIETMQQYFVKQSLKVADMVVHPNLENLGWTEFDRIEEFVERGRRAANEKIEEIKKFVGI
ncbi:MAG: cyclic nucleotide-binding domain-containing protein [Candidatus Omnitrophica bacterium]|nr:cyclic nucleotide-binding domain-containing protein [Candidatus Omnitrophota bacterium]MBD3268912.1 cyclic nucleotide-binding domain-containing protein [Candidatus Omnitrophota bacterium]